MNPKILVMALMLGAPSAQAAVSCNVKYPRVCVSVSPPEWERVDVRCARGAGCEYHIRGYGKYLASDGRVVFRTTTYLKDFSRYWRPGG